MFPKISKYLLLLICSKLNTSESACQDDSGKIDVGFQYDVPCDKIMAEYPEFCDKRNNVKMGCRKSCGTCNYDPFTDCQNTKGKFTVGHSIIQCSKASSMPNLCNWHIFQENCPVTCNLCVKTSTSVTQVSNECTGNPPDCCFGLTNACYLRVDEFLYAAMHNAYNDVGHWNSNHEKPLEDALEAGFRAFYLDVCYCHGEVVFCHGNCLWAGEQDPTEIFEHVVEFLDKNPSELVIFNFEMSSGDPTPSQLWDVMNQVSGLREKSYVHNDQKNWPRLGNLLSRGKQIISLKHNGDSCLNTSKSGCTPFIQEFFKYTVGTHYSFDSIEDIENIQQSCVGHRGTQYKKHFYAINNFVTNNFPGPSEKAAKVLNDETFVAQRISDCEKVTNMKANFLAVDFWQYGDVPKVTKAINIQRGTEKMKKYGAASSDGSSYQQSTIIFLSFSLVITGYFIDL